MNLKIGDRVRIEPLTDHEKDVYPKGWSTGMDAYVGKTTKIIDIIQDTNTYVLYCDGGKWAWSDENLVLVRDKIVLF